MRKAVVDEGETFAEAPKKKRRATVSTGHAPVPYPEKAATWAIKRDGVKLAAYSDAGAQAFDWPIRDFTVETIRERWGGGTFHAFFFDFRGKARGHKTFSVAGAPKAPQGDPVPAPEVRAEIVPAGGSRLGDALALATFIRKSAEEDSARTTGMLSQVLLSAQSNAKEMFAAAMGREQAVMKQQAAALPAELVQYLQRVEAKIGELTERIEAFEEEDPNEPREPGESGMPEPPEDWNMLGKVLYGFAQRLMPGLEQAAGELARSWLEKMQAEAAAKAAAARAANGAAAVAP